MLLKQRSISYTDGLLPKRILVVAHDRPLKGTRVSLLESEGYRVESVESDDAAMTLLETETFDLILLGRNSGMHKKFLEKIRSSSRSRSLTMRKRASTRLGCPILNPSTYS
jgi:DNA-binding response OmpR family regulator